MSSELLSLPHCLLSTSQILCRSHNPKHKVTLSNTKFLNGSSRQLVYAATKQLDTQNENRRSANYQPNPWTHEFIQSLRNHPEVETMQGIARKLEEKVRLIINRMDMEPLSMLEFIDDVERLGLSYKFNDDINGALKRIVSIESFKERKDRSLHETALLFRILRQRGFDISQDVFESFKDEEGKFKAEISKDVKGMLSLYEASHLTLEGESLWEANAFSRTHLMNSMKEGIKTEMTEQVRHVLEGLPYHLSFQKLDARQYIDIYNKKEPHNRLLLELAKLDFTMVQSSYQKELQEMSRWWTDIGIGSKQNFTRERFVESYLWSIAMTPEPQLGRCRKDISKVVQLIAIIDDVYDVYGTLDELEIFTDAVARWDMNVINTLPDDMVLCFLALYNTVNEMAYDIFKDRGVKCLPYLTKAWSDLCKSYLQEAKWFYNKVIPPFNKFLENGRISFGAGVLLVHAFFLVCEDQDITEQALHSLTNYHDPLRSSFIIARLCDDLGTFSDEIERGEISNSIVCYMHETGQSEEEARQYYRTLIDKEWKNLNKYIVMDSTIFSKSFIQVLINLARTTEYFYQYGDGYGHPDDISKSRIKLLLIDPIQIYVA